MKSVQNKLDSLTGTTGTVETQETSGAVTAVTSGEGTAPDTDSKENGDEDKSEGEQDAQTVPDSQSSSDVKSGAGAANSDNDGSKSAAGQNNAAQTDASGKETSSSANGSDGIYIVEAGDTLAIISRKMYGDVTHVDAICRMNGLTDGNLIYEGQKLLLP